jgi:EpsI family protein
MPELRRFAPAVIFALGCAFVWHARAQSAVPLQAPLSGVLSNVSGYRIQDQHLSNEERRVAGMTDYVARIYWRDSLPAFTTFVSYYDAQTQGKTIHSPRNCLPGAGWEVMSAAPHDIEIDGRRRTLNRYLLKNGASTAVVFYWYQGRGRIVASEYAVKWNLLRDAALAGHTEEALVRVVVPVVPPRAGTDTTAGRQAIAAATSLGADVAGRLAREVTRVLPGG